MVIPKIIFSDKILDRLSILMRIGGITLWPWIILREKYKAHYRTATVINHETIHIKQQQEMLVIPFYIWYILEYIVKFFKYGKNAYYNLSFEREAYTNEKNPDYLKTRKLFSWLKYL